MRTCAEWSTKIAWASTRCIYRWWTILRTSQISTVVCICSLDIWDLVNGLLAISGTDDSLYDFKPAEFSLSKSARTMVWIWSGSYAPHAIMQHQGSLVRWMICIFGSNVRKRFHGRGRYRFCKRLTVSLKLSSSMSTHANNMQIRFWVLSGWCMDVFRD